MSQSEDELRSPGTRAGPTDQRPLTDQEYQLLQRLLGDPFSFPIQFKTWLISYLESSDLNLPMSAVNGLSAILGIAGLGGGTLGILPAGIILPFGGDSAPGGALLCDGAAYLRTAQPRLFAAIGGRFGQPDAASFNVPDLRERIPVGRGALPEHDLIGKNENLPLGQRGTTHNSTVSLSIAASGDGSLSTGDSGTRDGILTLTDHAPSAHVFPYTYDVHGGPGGTRPVDGPAFLTINFIIIA